MAAEIAKAENEQLSMGETIAWLWKFWGNLKLAMVILLILTPVTMWFRSYTPMIISGVFDELGKPQVNLGQVKYLVGIFFLFNIIHLVLYIFIQSMRGVVNYLLENNFRISLFRYIITLGQSFFQKFNTGDLITRLIDDVS